jgi:hypothetical protein
MFSETLIINMLEFLIDNIFDIFGERIFQQTVGILMGTNCAPRQASFLTGTHCQIRGVGQGMKQTYLYLWYPFISSSV